MSVASYRSSHFAFRDTPLYGLGDLRTAALATFDGLGFPNRRVETWKYTSVKRLANVPFEHDARGDQERDAVQAFAGSVSLGEHVAAEIVLLNGRFVGAWSRTDGLPEGVTVTSLQHALEHDLDGVREVLGQYAETGGEAFTALNTAFLQDGLYLHVANGVELKAPIQLTVLADPGAGPIVAHPRHVIRIDRSASAVFVERHAGRSGSTVFTNAVSEIVLGDGAQLTHHLWSHGGDAETRIGRVQVQVGRDAHYTNRSFWLSGGLARNDLNVVLSGPGAGTTLDGLYIVGGDQHVDNHVTIDHAAPHTTSRMDYRGVLGGAATGVYNGRVVVRKAAQKTDSEQSNRNLLLSPKADVNTKPELEIYADDVKCGHGTTVGQLPVEQLHYLRTRGVPYALARTILTQAFVGDRVEAIDSEPLRSVLTELVSAQMDCANGVGA